MERTSEHKHWFRRDDSSCGAIMLEFALVVGLFVFLILGIIDFARVLAAQALLTKGAQEGLNLAQKLANVNVDYRTWTSLTPDPGFFSFPNGSYYKVVNASIQLPLDSSLLSTGAGSSIELLPFDREFINNINESILAINGQYALLLRPGEKALAATGSGYKLICHSTLERSGDTQCAATAALRVSDNYNRILEEHPLELYMRARVRMFTPGIPDVEIEGVARGYREGFSNTSYAMPPTVTFGTGTATTTTLPAICDSSHPKWCAGICCGINQTCTNTQNGWICFAGGG